MTIGIDFEKFCNRNIGIDFVPKRNEQFTVLPDSWRELAGKKSHTPDEAKRLDKEYKEGFLNFGRDYKNHIDSKYGNGDGKLTIDEYVNSELSSLPKEYSYMKNELAQGARNAFNCIDLNADKQIDEKEMAALMSMFDMDINNGGINGKIKIEDMEACSYSLVEDPNNKYGKGIKQKLINMYNFLFPQSK